MNYFNNFVDIIFFVILSNQFHLTFFKIIEIVFVNDENVTFDVRYIKISITHVEKFEFARVLFSNLLHQNNQQIVKLINRYLLCFHFMRI